MITRIELRNFMSHEHTVIEPAAGLTVIVGPNNCGKSALVAALKVLCQNGRNKHVVRHGAKECSVEVHTSDGHKIRWRRRNDSTSYLIDDTPFDRLKTGIPDQLHQLLRLPEVPVSDKESFDIHFGEQKAPLFLINSPASHAAQFFASSSDASRLVEMQRLHRERSQEKQREKKLLEQRSLALSAELETLEPAVELEIRIEALEAEHRQLVELQTRVDAAAATLRALHVHSLRTDQLEQHATSLAPLAPPPVLADTDALAALCAALHAADRTCQLAAQRSTALAAVAAPPELADEVPLQNLATNIGELARQSSRLADLSAVAMHLSPAPLLEDVVALERLIEQLTVAQRNEQCDRQRESVLQPLAEPPATSDAAALAGLISALSDAERHASQHAGQYDIVSRVEPPPALVDPVEIARHLDQWSQATAALAKLESVLAESAADLAAAADDLRRWAADQGVCPTCGAPIDGDALLASAASGRPEHQHG